MSLDTLGGGVLGLLAVWCGCGDVLASTGVWAHSAPKTQTRLCQTLSRVDTTAHGREHARLRTLVPKVDQKVKESFGC